MWSSNRANCEQATKQENWVTSLCALTSTWRLNQFVKLSLGGIYSRRICWSNIDMADIYNMECLLWLFLRVSINNIRKFLLFHISDMLNFTKWLNPLASPHKVTVFNCQQTWCPNSKIPCWYALIIGFFSSSRTADLIFLAITSRGQKSCRSSFVLILRISMRSWSSCIVCQLSS